MWLRAISVCSCSACLQIRSLDQSVLHCVMCVNIPSIQFPCPSLCPHIVSKKDWFFIFREYYHKFGGSLKGLWMSKCCEDIDPSRSNIVQTPDVFYVWKSYFHQTSWKFFFSFLNRWKHNPHPTNKQKNHQFEPLAKNASL